MIISKLKNGWKMREMGAEDYLNAEVPGSVYHDLMTNGKMEDPYYRDNELAALELMNRDYEYVCRFRVSSELLK